MKRKILYTILASILIFSVFPQTGFAVDSDERAKAVDYVTANNIFVGDGSGNFNLEFGLTRAELAVLLVRLRGDEEKVNANMQSYVQDCYFHDVPAWAKPSVGYCAGEGLMVGYSQSRFGPGDNVTPQQACTVILRHIALPETGWSYDTAVNTATSIGIAPTDGFSDMAAIKRAEMAILIYKSAIHLSTPAMTIDEMKTEIIRLTNTERISADCPELTVLPALMDTAQAKAQDFIDNHYFGHVSPRYGTPGEMIRAVIPNAGYCGEILGGWSKTPQDAFAGFLDSQEHLNAMLNAKYTHIGAGIVEGVNGGYWWVLQFISL